MTVARVGGILLAALLGPVASAAGQNPPPPPKPPAAQPDTGANRNPAKQDTAAARAKAAKPDSAAKPAGQAAQDTARAGKLPAKPDSTTGTRNQPKPKATAKAQPKPIPASERCKIEIVNVDRQGVRTSPTAGTENYYAGGNVHFRCIGRAIDMYADSVASYGGTVIQFISQGNRVRYRDSTATLDADFGTYFKDGERFEAQGNVIHTDLKSGSTIKATQINYLRPLKGVRPDLEVVAYNRPTVNYLLTDSAGRQQTPYVIVGNQIKFVGSDALNAGGNVTIDRDDLKGTGDSLWLDSGKKEGGQLIGRATLRTDQRDGAFTLTGKTIDFITRKKELVGLRGKDPGRLVSKDITLDADSVQIDLTQKQVETTRAWGKAKRPVAMSGDFRILGDSIRIETPAQKLNRVFAFGNAWAGGAADTTVKNRRKDWIAGEKVIARFVERDSAGAKKTTIRELEAETNARSYYQMAPEKGQLVGSINYTRATKILVTMRITPDSTTVDRVDARGAVDGVHLQPAVKRDTTRRRDTTVARPNAGARP